MQCYKSGKGTKKSQLSNFCKNENRGVNPLYAEPNETEWETCGLWTEFAHGNTTRKRVAAPKRNNLKMIKAGRDSSAID